ncbi:uncharacterized protein [Coffea arabica]|uniref:Uncharacterized protein n=1 Tax=Coffea arabica TaxID=13443 RepID=A0A6P6UDU0_COFAR|nr:U3 small nucleolar RNA-associated protein 6 homolog [Coffea arabica]
MADVVQFKLERMLNELEDLERRGLFSRREIAEIVKQRRKFEYRLKRPSPLKEDFLAYIEYEKKLDELRLLRKKALLKHQTGKDKKWKKSVADYAGVSRIVEIYRLATNRFKGDIQLWFQYLEFCRQRRNGRMKKALAQLIRFHPKVPGVWIYAAAWEFDQNLNTAAARALMQNGLRACPTSEDLWVEYLRMELTYLNKLKARRVALGEDDGTLTRDPREAAEKQWRAENSELFMALDEEKEDALESNANAASEEKPDLFRVKGLSILRTVYSGAIEALPSSFSLRTRFFEILEATDLTHSDDMRDEILADLRRDFSKEPEFWDWLARQQTYERRSGQKKNEEIFPEQFRKTIQVYEEGLKAVPSATMFEFYVKFLMDAISCIIGDNQPEDSSKSGQGVDPISHLLMVYEEAQNSGFISEDLACEHVSFLLQLGKLHEARKLVEKLCAGKFSNSVKLWALQISIDMRCVQDRSNSPTKANLSSIFDILINFLTHVAISEAEKLWRMAFKYFAHHQHYFDKLVETSVVALTKFGGSDNGFSLGSTVVNHVLQRDGVQRAREIYKRLLALPRPGLILFQNCIELEMNLASVGNSDCLVNARKLFESALTTYSQEPSLWRDYYTMEVKIGTPDKAAALHWRARKALKYNVKLATTNL